MDQYAKRLWLAKQGIAYTGDLKHDTMWNSATAEARDYFRNLCAELLDEAIAEELRASSGHP